MGVIQNPIRFVALLKNQISSCLFFVTNLNLGLFISLKLQDRDI